MTKKNNVAMRMTRRGNESILTFLIKFPLLKIDGLYPDLSPFQADIGLSAN